MGVPFEVKPTPINISSVKKERQEMIRSWYEQNKPDLLSKMDDKTATIEDWSVEEVQSLEDWKSDVEFRASYCKFTGEKSMKFSKPVSDEIWASNELELSTLEEAWDFFVERRQVP